MTLFPSRASLDEDAYDEIVNRAPNHKHYSLLPMLVMTTKMLNHFLNTFLEFFVF